MLIVTVASFILACTSVASAENAGGRIPPAIPEPTTPLPPRGPDPNSAPASTNSSKVGNSLTTVVGGLAVCLGLFFLLVWVTKRNSTTATAVLPVEVVEALGRAPLSGRQQLQLLRVGRKLVLLNVTPTSAETITEITDPAEVDRLLGYCQQRKANSVTASFRDVLVDYESTPTPKNFLGNSRQSDWELATKSPRSRTSSREDADD